MVYQQILQLIMIGKFRIHNTAHLIEDKQWLTLTDLLETLTAKPEVVASIPTQDK